MSHASLEDQAAEKTHLVIINRTQNHLSIIIPYNGGSFNLANLTVDRQIKVDGNSATPNLNPPITFKWLIRQISPLYGTHVKHVRTMDKVSYSVFVCVSV